MSVGAVWFVLTVGPCTSFFLHLSVVVLSFSSPSSSHGSRPTLSLDDAADPALETSTALRLVHHGHGPLCAALHLEDVHQGQRYKSIAKDPIHVPSTSANAKHPNV